MGKSDNSIGAISRSRSRLEAADDKLNRSRTTRSMFSMLLPLLVVGLTLYGCFQAFTDEDGWDNKIDNFLAVVSLVILVIAMATKMVLYFGQYGLAKLIERMVCSGENPIGPLVFTVGMVRDLMLCVPLLALAGVGWSFNRINNAAGYYYSCT